MLAMKCLYNIKNNNDGRTKQSVRSDIENSQIPIIHLTLDICGCSEATQTVMIILSEYRRLNGAAHMDPAAV